MTAPSWLRHSHGGATRTVRIRLCSRCHNPILTGLDADICALPARVDPVPVSELGEALARIDNRCTYDYVKTRAVPVLEYRESWTIAAPRRFPVLAEHKCGHPLPADTTPEIQKPKISDEPEF